MTNLLYLMLLAAPRATMANADTADEMGQAIAGPCDEAQFTAAVADELEARIASAETAAQEMQRHMAAWQLFAQKKQKSTEAKAAQALAIYFLSEATKAGPIMRQQAKTIRNAASTLQQRTGATLALGAIQGSGKITLARATSSNNADLGVHYSSSAYGCTVSITAEKMQTAKCNLKPQTGEALHGKAPALHKARSIKLLKDELFAPKTTTLLIACKSPNNGVTPQNSGHCSQAATMAGSSGGLGIATANNPKTHDKPADQPIYKDAEGADTCAPYTAPTELTVPLKATVAEALCKTGKLKLDTISTPANVAPEQLKGNPEFQIIVSQLLTKPGENLDPNKDSDKTKLDKIITDIYSES
uniref:Variant surface glycoprotein 1125.1752 n=1 Tax=Trypanosoma brucei TaxID=5691 RepID=A0A1J0R7M3_9TRYP|nr:variant surface glycoprotein 1125.1752 [Trypanosoma brucei]